MGLTEKRDAKSIIKEERHKEKDECVSEFRLVATIGLKYSPTGRLNDRKEPLNATNIENAVVINDFTENAESGEVNVMEDCWEQARLDTVGMGLAMEVYLNEGFVESYGVGKGVDLAADENPNEFLKFLVDRAREWME